MPDYQLQIRQMVSYPRCRIYREFLQTLIADRGVRINGRPGLFCLTVLCIIMPLLPCSDMPSFAFHIYFT